MVAPDLAGIWIATVRAQVIAYLCLTFLMVAFLKVHHERNYRWLTFAPLALFLWVNSHGSYVIGLGFLGVFAACSLLHYQSRDIFFILFVTALCIPLPLLTPYREEFLAFSLGQISNRPYEIVEWAPFLPWTVDGIYRYGIVALMLAGILTGGRRYVPLEGLAFIALGAAWGLRHGRLSRSSVSRLAVTGCLLAHSTYLWLKGKVPNLADFIRRGSILGLGAMSLFGVIVTGTNGPQGTLYARLHALPGKRA